MQLVWRQGGLSLYRNAAGKRAVIIRRGPYVGFSNVYTVGDGDEVSDHETMEQAEARVREVLKDPS